MSPPRRYLTCSEVAITLAVHKATVRRWCRQGTVKTRYTPGGDWRLEVDSEGWPIFIEG